MFLAASEHLSYCSQALSTMGLPPIATDISDPSSAVLAVVSKLGLPVHSFQASQSGISHGSSHLASASRMPQGPQPVKSSIADLSAGNPVRKIMI